MAENRNDTYLRKPDWLKIKLPQGKKYLTVKKTVQQHGLHTICVSGNCPNMGECWEAGTATFMILGEICTRSCRFCAVTSGKPFPLDSEEPIHVAQSVKLLNLKHCVLTSVDRDDLVDGGANTWAEVIKAVKTENPQTTIEALIPDFQGKTDLLKIVIDSKPEIISHNLETVRRLTPTVRSRAKYELSLNVLKYISDSGTASKSGIMLGLGETNAEVLETMDDLLSVGCHIMTIGQYLQPTRNHLKVEAYIKPEQFSEYETIGLKKGFKFIESNPLVRSSYHAEKHI
jgi:lipoic acid synthetase